MLRTRVKTKYKDLVWVHSKYLKAIEEKNETLVIIYDGQEMTVTKTTLQEVRPVRGKEQYKEQWGLERGQKYRLYGFSFEPDQGTLF